jgi:hypothetical protein
MPAAIECGANELIDSVRATPGGVVGDHQGLEVAVELERVVAALAADAGDPAPAEGRREIAHEERVHPHQPGADRAAHPFGALARRRVHDRRQAVGGAVGELDGLGLVGEGLEREHRPEDLALHDLAGVGRGFDERGLVVQAAVDRPAAAHDHVARCPCPFDEGVDLGEVVGVHHRGDVGGGVAAVAEHQGVGVAVEAREELVADRRLDEEPRAGEAHLAGVVVLPRRPVRGGIEVGVGEHDEGPLPPSSAVNGTMLSAAARPMWRAVSGNR